MILQSISVELLVAAVQILVDIVIHFVLAQVWECKIKLTRFLPISADINEW